MLRLIIHSVLAFQARSNTWLWLTRSVTYCFGGDGDDVIFGNAGEDHLSGGDGDDLLLGGYGNDVIIDRAGRGPGFWRHGK